MALTICMERQIVSVEEQMERFIPMDISGGRILTSEVQGGGVGAFHL